MDTFGITIKFFNDLNKQRFINDANASENYRKNGITAFVGTCHKHGNGIPRYCINYYDLSRSLRGIFHVFATFTTFPIRSVPSMVSENLTF